MATGLETTSGQVTELEERLTDEVREMTGRDDLTVEFEQGELEPDGEPETPTPTIVVDVGCAAYADQEESIGPLIARFKPERLIGFDPLTEDAEYNHEGCHVMQRRTAAWIANGQIELGVGFNDLNATIVRDKSTRGEWSKRETVDCFDLCAFLADLHDQYPEHRVILKLDCEGAEYALLKRIAAYGMDSWLHLILVEWHGALMAADYGAWQRELTRQLRGKLEVWQ